nr:hypothetical protein 42 [Burkholderiaceae bacterium]
MEKEKDPLNPADKERLGYAVGGPKKPRVETEITLEDQILMDKIKNARRVLDMSQGELANALGLKSRIAVSMWESATIRRGKKVLPSRGRVKEIAKLLDIPWQWFYDEELDPDTFLDKCIEHHIDKESSEEVDRDIVTVTETAHKVGKGKHIDVGIKSGVAAAIIRGQLAPFDKRYKGRLSAIRKEYREWVDKNAAGVKDKYGTLDKVEREQLDAYIAAQKQERLPRDSEGPMMKRRLPPTPAKSYNFYPAVEHECENAIEGWSERYKAVYTFFNTLDMQFDYLDEKEKNIVRYTTLHPNQPQAIRIKPGLREFLNEIRSRIQEMLFQEKLLGGKWNKFIMIYDRSADLRKDRSITGMYGVSYLRPMAEQCGIKLIFVRNKDEAAKFLLDLSN